MAKRIPVPLDPKEIDSRVRITDFAGMSPGTDLHDNDPGESWYQVNVVPFHPGELRVRRGFVVCQFEVSPSAVLVAPPLSRFAEAASSIWMHSDARRAREIEVKAWQNLVISVDQPTSNWHKVNATTQVVLTGIASTRQGNANELLAISGQYRISAGIFSSSRGSFGRTRLSAETGVYPNGSPIQGGIANTLDGVIGVYTMDGNSEGRTTNALAGGIGLYRMEKLH